MECRHYIMEVHRQESVRRERANKDEEYFVYSWVGVKFQNAHADLQEVSSKFAKKYSGP